MPRRGRPLSTKGYVRLAHACPHFLAEAVFVAVLEFHPLGQAWQEAASNYDDAIAVTDNGITWIANDITAGDWNADLAWAPF